MLPWSSHVVLSTCHLFETLNRLSETLKYNFILRFIARDKKLFFNQKLFISCFSTGTCAHLGRLFRGEKGEKHLLDTHFYLDLWELIYMYVKYWILLKPSRRDDLIEDPNAHLNRALDTDV